MAKPFKIFLIVVGVFVVLIAGAALAAVALFDAEEIKAKVSTAARDNTGRELTIAGDLDLSLFPWLGVSLSDATLANAEGFGPEPFAHLGAMEVRVKLLPLLIQRRVKIGKVTINDLAVNLTRNKDGTTNWDDLAKGETGDAEPAPEAPEQPAQAGQPPQILALEVGGLHIRDVAISMVDRQAGTSYKVEKLNLETGPVTLKDPIDVALSFVATASEPQVSADVKLSLTASHENDATIFEARGLKLDVSAKGEAVPAGSQDVSLATDVRFDKDAGLAEFKGLILDAMGVRLNSDAALNLKADTLDLSNTVIEARGVKVNANIKGTGITGEAPDISGKLTAAPFNPRDLARQLEAELPPMSDDTALTQASFSSDFASDLKSARLDNITVKLDQSTMTGYMHVTDLATQSIKFALKLDSINADRYLPAPAEDASAKDADGEGDFRKTELPIGALDAVNAKGRLEIGELVFRKSKLSNVVLDLDAPKGKVKTQTLTAKAYGGTLSQSAKINPGEKPTYTLTAALKQIEAGPVIQTFTGKKYLSGLGDLQLNIASGGSTIGDALKGLNGSVSSSLVKGAIEGFNLRHKVDQARALYNKEELPTGAPKRTEFADLAGSGEIKNGVLTTKTLKASGNDYNLTGDGAVDLAGLKIDYTLLPTYTGGADLKGLGGLAIPVRVSGDLFSPEVKVDVAGALKGKAKEAVKEEVKKQKEKLKEKAIDRLGNFLAPKKKKDEPATEAEGEPAQP